MKKVLSVLLIGCVVILALMGALTVFPHMHGSDTDHSSHKTCPVYQLGLHSVDMMVFAVVGLAVIFLFKFFRQKKEAFSYNPSIIYLSPRAPPLNF